MALLTINRRSADRVAESVDANELKNERDAKLMLLYGTTSYDPESLTTDELTYEALP